jgi:hypothetical protein
VKSERPALSKLKARRRACPEHLDKLDTGKLKAHRWSKTKPVVPIVASQFNAAVIDGTAFLIGGQTSNGMLRDTNYLYYQP